MELARRNWMLEKPLEFTGIQFFNLPPSPNTVSEAARDYLPLTVERLCDLQGTMSRHWSPSAYHPTLA